MITGHVPAVRLPLVTRTATWLRLSRRQETWRIAEILILRHRLAVLQRRQRGRPNLNWADRTLLAAPLCGVTRERGPGLRLLVPPDTILRWHRDIVRRRWAARSMPGRTGRPATRRNIRALVLRLARENPVWGYRRIHGELASLGVNVAASTIWEILKKTGIDPAPRRTGPAWSQFLRSQAEAILACDFFTADLLDGTQAYLGRVLRQYEIHQSAPAAPVTELRCAAETATEPVDLGRYHVRRQTHTGCLINEYRLAHDVDEVFGTHNPAQPSDRHI